MQNRPTWFEVGYQEGFAGKEIRVPEGYGVRMSYTRGWEQGHMDKTLQDNGYSIKGCIDEWLAK